MTTASPLATIERLAQDRAAETVERWNAEHRDGRRPVALDEDVIDRALRNLVGYGPLGPLLEDDDVWEIMVNGPDGTFG